MYYCNVANRCTAMACMYLCPTPSTITHSIHYDKKNNTNWAAVFINAPICAGSIAHRWPSHAKTPMVYPASIQPRRVVQLLGRHQQAQQQQFGHGDQPKCAADECIRHHQQIEPNGCIAVGKNGFYGKLFTGPKGAARCCALAQMATLST